MLSAIGRVKLGTRAAIRKIWIAKASDVSNLYFDAVQRVTSIQMKPDSFWHSVSLPTESCFLSQGHTRQKGSNRVTQTLSFTPGAMNPVTRNALYHLSQECAVHILAKQDDGQILYLGVSYIQQNDTWHTEQAKVTSGSGNTGSNRNRDANQYLFSITAICNFVAPFYIGGISSLPTKDGDPVIGTDLFPPVLVIPSPADGATQVPIKPTFTAIFNETILPGVGAIVLKRYSDDAPIASWTVTDISDVSFPAPDQIQLAAVPALATGTRYYFDFPAGCFVDASGQSYAGTTNKDVWDFTTQAGPAAAPLLSSLSPVDGATGFDPTAGSISLTFDSAVQEGVGSFRIYKYSDDSLLGVIPALSSRVTFNGSSVISIDILGLVQPSTEYYLLSDSGTVENMDGVDWLSTLDDKDDWNFTTSAFGTAPSITLYEPANSSDNQSQAPTIRLTFDEAISLDTGIIKLIRAVDLNGEAPGGLDVSVKEWDASTGTDLTLSSGDTVLTFGDVPVLESSQVYYLLIPATAFQDVEGLYIPEIVRPGTGDFWAFTVQTAPVLTYDPESAATASNNSFDPSITSTATQVLTDGTDKYVRIFDYATDVLVKTILIPGANPPASGDGYRFDGNTIWFEFIPFTAENQLYILMDEGVMVNSVSGVKTPAISLKSEWNFTLAADGGSPFLISYPAGSTLDPDSPITLSLILNKWVSINPIGKRWRIYRADGQCVFEGNMKDSSFWKSWETNASASASAYWQVILPPKVLVVNEAYFIRVEEGAWIDRVGNDSVAITDNRIWFKTTGSSVSDNTGFGSPTGEPVA